jgi:hypothetical protein
MRLKFAPFTYNREDGLPGARLLNMHPEPTPVSGGFALLQRHGLASSYSLGTAGVRGLYQQDGVFGGDVFAVAGTDLYRGTDSLGTVALGTHAKFAGSPTQLVVVVGGSAYCYDGSTLTAIDVDGQTVSDVALIGDRFYFSVVDDDRVYFSALDDATSVDALSFFTADGIPDAIVGLAALNDRLVIFGRTSTEFWQQTGDPDAPLIRSQGTSYTRGCVSARSIGAPKRVSHHAMEEAVRECETPDAIVGLAVSWDGNDFVVLNVPGTGTYALHIETEQWAEWSSHGQAMFRCDTATMVQGVAHLGDRLTGTVFTLDHDRTDDGDPMHCIASCLAPAGVIHSLELACAKGVGLEDNEEPIVEMRYSRDGGRTWGTWNRRSLGLIGDYETRVRWTRLGDCRRERLIEFRVTSPVMVSLQDVQVNE